MAKIDPNEPCPCGSGLAFGECHGPKVKNQQPPPVSQRVPLTVVPEPDPGTASVFIRDGEGTVVFQGYETEIAQCCGRCGAPLIVGMRPNQVSGIVFRCNACGAFNGA